MTEKVMIENDVPEEGEPASFRKSRSGIVIAVLSVLVGILLVVGVAGFFMACRVDWKLEAELVSIKEELRKKSVAHDDMKSQNEALSRQMATLKEYAIARSGSAVGDAKATESHPVPSDKAKPESREAQPPVAEPRPKESSANEPPVKEGAAKEAATPITSKDAAVKTKAGGAPSGNKGRKTGEDKAVSCDLLGKSLEEKEETLRRCVGIMDGDAAKPRLR